MARQAHEATRGLYGHITHTDLRSDDPEATKAWCQDLFGWRFDAPVPSPGGEYHLFAYSDHGGGGISRTPPGMTPGSTPFVHVEDARDAYAQALAAGAEPILAPESPMPGVTIALVRAPGGVAIGLSGP